MTERQISEVAAERLYNRNGKKLKLILTHNLKDGDYACNTGLDYVYQVNESIAECINMGVTNGGKNVLAVLCDKCNNVARHDYNGTDLYLCDDCKIWEEQK